MGTNGWLGHEDFAGLVGDTFELVLPDAERLALVLRETSLVGQVGGVGPDGVAREQFSLLFTGPEAPVLAQATWAVSHVGLGDLELFLVPLGPAPGGMRYEAAFA
ncbi:hypothetical protein KVF89_07090 [Nocardioides carbamazepini]|uniref:DUF6916 family protein n=1 Tax=Nocardioides carbamazepini TaxID=2854259 RepID=UPI00214A3458|nr:hypothetical protein [Nocardioides carbamazepini]MCR1782292.1 hypothetical protein [Nocardioides carbamazepini]